MTYKNVVFDLDDTLYDHLLPFKRSVQSCFPSVNIASISDIYTRFRYWSDVAFPKYTKHLISIEELRIFRCQKTMAEFGLPNVTEEEAINFQKDYEKELDRITLIPTVKYLLDLLVENHIPIGLLTNGPVDLQTKKLINLGALAYFNSDNILISQSTGYNKPQRQIFDIAAEKFDFNPEKTLFIGDTFTNDIEGSFNAGWVPVWFNHRKRNIPKGKENIDYFAVNSSEELLKLVKIIFNLTKKDSN